MQINMKFKFTGSIPSFQINLIGSPKSWPVKGQSQLYKIGYPAAGNIKWNVNSSLQIVKWELSVTSGSRPQL